MDGRIVGYKARTPSGMNRISAGRFPERRNALLWLFGNEKDKYRYQGLNLQFVGFDETSQFFETQYTYLFSRLRRLAGSVVPLSSAVPAIRQPR